MIEKILERLEAELKLADEVKKKCARENPLMFDNAKGYSTGIANAKYIVQEVAKEYEDEYKRGYADGFHDCEKISGVSSQCPKGE